MTIVTTILTHFASLTLQMLIFAFIFMDIIGIIKVFPSRGAKFRGYPSRFIRYTLKNICAKFHTFIISVTKISIRDWTSMYTNKI